MTDDYARLRQRRRFLLTAGGATFAAFPQWYATLFSGFYLPLFLMLVALIVRGVAFEFRSKDDSPTWRALWAQRLRWQRGWLCRLDCSNDVSFWWLRGFPHIHDNESAADTDCSREERRCELKCFALSPE